MSWLKNLVRPKIATRTKREVPDNLWLKCPGCNEMLYRKDLSANLHTCGSCNHHLRWPVEERLAHLFDEGSREAIPLPLSPEDPLKFRDLKKYADRLKDARKAADTTRDACRVEYGTISGQPAIVCAFDFSFMAGSMGVAVGQAIVTAAEEAQRRKLPLMIIPASGGARMQEGILSLMQMARTTAAINSLRESGQPYLVLLTDPTTGGVTASFAMIGDVTLSEPGAMIGFAGPRVIQQTIGETLPEGFQSAEYLLEHGMVDVIVHRREQSQKIGNILKHLHTARAAAE